MDKKIYELVTVDEADDFLIIQSAQTKGKGRIEGPFHLEIRELNSVFFSPMLGEASISTKEFEMWQKAVRVPAVLLVCSMVIGCGYKDLPKMRAGAQSPFEQMMIPYRLRSDVAYQMAELAKNYPQLATEVEAMQESRSTALSVELNLEKFDERQANRFQSYQNFLSRDVSHFTSKAQEINAFSSQQEYLSLVSQYNRVGQRLVQLKRDYLVVAEKFNEQKEKFPYWVYNRIQYQFAPLPDIGAVAASGGL